MKNLLRNYFFSLISLYLVSLIVKGFSYTAGLKTLFYGALIFTLINLFVKPLIKIFMIPLNFLSLGLFSWVINVSMLYFLTRILPEIKISSWQFSKFSAYGFIIPTINFTVFYTYLLISFLISLIINFLNWLCSK